MNTTILKCRDCGAILVVNNKDLWKLRRCTSCESANLEDIDEIFGFSEVGDNDEKSTRKV